MRLRRTDGFTLIELLVVLVIVAILLSVAVAAYFGMRTRANDGAAKQMLRSALPSVHGYAADHDGFAGMTVPDLRGYDSGLGDVDVLGADAASFCLRASVDGRDWYAAGPPFSVSQTSCA